MSRAVFAFSTRTTSVAREPPFKKFSRFAADLFTASERVVHNFNLSIYLTQKERLLESHK